MRMSSSRSQPNDPVSNFIISPTYRCSMVRAVAMPTWPSGRSRRRVPKAPREASTRCWATVTTATSSDKALAAITAAARPSPGHPLSNTRTASRLMHASSASSARSCSRGESKGGLVVTIPTYSDRGRCSGGACSAWFRSGRTNRRAIKPNDFSRSYDILTQCSVRAETIEYCRGAGNQPAVDPREVEFGGIESLQRSTRSLEQGTTLNIE